MTDDGFICGWCGEWVDDCPRAQEAPRPTDGDLRPMSRSLKPLLDAHGLDRNPQHVTEDCWFYEEKGGIHLCVERMGDRKVEQVRIPFRKLVTSLRRIAKARGEKL